MSVIGGFLSYGGKSKVSTRKVSTQVMFNIMRDTNWTEFFSNPRNPMTWALFKGL